MTKILIMDELVFYREAMKMVLKKEKEFTVVGEGADGNDVVTLFEKHHPDIVLMEVRLSRMSGIKATERLINKYPDAKVIIFSMYEDETYVLQSLKGGARGYMLKEMDADSVILAIKEVASGGSYLHPKVQKKFLKELQFLARKDAEFSESNIFSRTPHHILTKRECGVLQLLVDGQSNRRISETLTISEKTVKNHVSKILTKLDVNDRTCAVVMAIKNGWVEIESYSKEAYDKSLKERLIEKESKQYA